MYENQTYEKILDRMLARAGGLDTREGSLVWYAGAPAAAELQNLYIELDTVLRESFADTASRDYLVLRARERGLSPYPASSAVLALSVQPEGLTLPLGTRFSIGELNYTVTQNENGHQLTCETPGAAGSRQAGNVIPIEYVPGLESAAVAALLIPGEDEEDTESFRRRYFGSLDAEAFGGNLADYREKVNAIPGVGGVKVTRAWNGDIRPSELQPPEGTAAWVAAAEAPAPVKSWLTKVFEAADAGKLTVGGAVRLAIIDSDFSVPSAALIELVQQTVDPVSGEGLGFAPIGHVVTVEGVQAAEVSVGLQLSYRNGWDFAAVKPYLEETVSGYFKELAQSWADEEGPLVVRVSGIESRVLALAGILDVTGTTLDGSEGNLALPADSIPVLSEVSEWTGG